MKKLLFIFFLLIPSLCFGAVTVYYPTGDTVIKPSDETPNYTEQTSSIINVDGSLLFDFNLTGLTTGEVVSAQFDLYGGTKGGQANLYVGEVLKDFVDTQATWTNYSTGNAWGTAGANGANVDYAVTGLVTTSVPDNSWITIDATNLVRNMIRDAMSGLIVFASAGNMYQTAWRMSEYTGVDYDPKLTIRTGNPGEVTTWYVRPDGGTCGLNQQCEGTTDAAYDGSGINEACACAKPNYLNNLMIGEDIVIIKSGSYEITGTFNPPSGTNISLKTKVYGEGWDSGCSSPPELYISPNVTSGVTMINLINKDYLDIQCLEITDHTTEAGTTWGTNKLMDGIYASDSDYVSLKNINIHGGYKGIHAGRLSNWDLENVKLNYNRSAGWDGDIGALVSDNSGILNFTNVEIIYNGCEEVWDNEGTPVDCCGQNNGCYGDGLGTHRTGGTWNFINCNFSHNASDGLDLLYASSDLEVNVYRSLMEGNTGNQLKIPNKSHVENSLIIGNCGYFYGQSFTRPAVENAGYEFPYCRSFGNTIEIVFKDNNSPEFYNNTIIGNGDVLFDTTGTCLSGTDVILSNNIMYGGRQWFDDCTRPGANPDCGDDSVSVYYDASVTCDTDKIESYNICYSFKEGSSSCNGTGSTDTIDPGFLGTIKQGPYNTDGYYTDNDYYKQLYIPASTGSADETVNVVSSNDFNNFSRGTEWDIGAYEYGSTPQSPSCQVDCSLCLTESSCIGSQTDCYWWANGSCQTTQDPCNLSCVNCTTESTCGESDQGCYWWSTETCNSTEEITPATCDTDCTLCTTNQAECEASEATCYWWGSSAQTGYFCNNIEDPCGNRCTSCVSPGSCIESNTYYGNPDSCYWWDDNVCRSEEQNCSTDCEECTTQSTCQSSAEGCYWTSQNTCVAYTEECQGRVNKGDCESYKVNCTWLNDSCVPLSGTTHRNYTSTNIKWE